ncbi:hypothetical protein QOZ80_1BG0088020 [Eleusine coracana subsp. coracana]|nr:hypothetical protein QOZ80_1BG0088020 [Eleusine coracana subsp. coracana]
MSMLKQNDDSKRIMKTMATEIRTGDSFGVCTLAKHKLIKGAVTSHKNHREAEFTRKEVTPEPHKDGYQWQKYGQKNIQNFSFMRHYFRCHNQRCNAKKRVQQLNGGSSDEGDAPPPMFEVTYVDDHTCQHVGLANNSTTMEKSCIKAGENTSRNGGGGALLDLLRHRIGGGADEIENEAIVSCLATVISGTTPSTPGVEPTSDDAPWYEVPSAEDDGNGMADTTTTTTMTMAMDTGFSWDEDASFWPAEVDNNKLMMIDDVHMVDAASRFVVDTVWPHEYYTREGVPSRRC